MPTSLPIDEDLLAPLTNQAVQHAVPAAALANQFIRQALGLAPQRDLASSPTFHQPTFSMGQPLVHTEKLLSVSDQLADEHVLDQLNGAS